MSGNATSSTYPLGFASRNDNAGWGDQTGSTVTCWNDSSGGSVDWRMNNPSSGKISIKVDGRFYGNEGTDPAMLLVYKNSYYGMAGPDGSNTTSGHHGDNVWIRTTNQGILPYQNGGITGGHQYLGTSSWYFAYAYATNIFTHKLRVGESTASTMTASGIHIHDIRDMTVTPNTFGDHNFNLYFDQECSDGDWKGIMHVKGWNANYYAWQLAGNATTTLKNKLYYREGSGTTWNTWLSVAFENRANTFTASGNSFTNGLSVSNLLSLASGSSHYGAKIGSVYINAIDGNLIFQNLGALRFGTDAWDYNQWAGLKYDHSNKYIYLGLADNSIFTANQAQSGGRILTPGISYFHVGNQTSYYLASSGLAQLKGIVVANRGNSTAASNYTDSAIEIREYNFGGAQDDTWGVAPRLSFHWGGRTTAQIGLASNGYLYAANASNSGTAMSKIVLENSGQWGISISGHSRYLETMYQDKSKWYGSSYRMYGWWETGSVCKLTVDGYTTKVDEADKLDGYHASSFLKHTDMPLTTITKTLTVTTNWQNTGIVSSNLATGTYAVQVSGINNGNCGLWGDIFSGVMSWYNGGTNDSSADEIMLHSAGHARNGGHIFLRVLRSANSDGKSYLQIKALSSASASQSVTFTFRRLI